MTVARRIIGLLLCGLALAGSALAAGPGDAVFLRARRAYQELQGSPQKQQSRDNWLRVVAELDAAVVAHPGHAEAADALFRAGKSWEGLYRFSRRTEDARSAVQCYDRLAAEYSASSLADDALYLGGSVLERLGDMASAFLRYQSAVERFPEGDLTPLARLGRDRLQAHAPKEVPAVAALQPVPVPDGPAGPVEISQIRHWSNPGYTRIVLEMDGRAEYKVNMLRADPAHNVGPRLVIDFNQSKLHRRIPTRETVRDGLLQSIRTGYPDDRTARVVLDLVSVRDYKIFPLYDPNRLVIDVAAAEGSVLQSRTSELSSLPVPDRDPIARVVSRAEPEPTATMPAAAKAPPAGLRRIVVDAGHGGKDPGAVGPSGIKEKDVNLAMALVVAKKLEQELGCEVILTRKTDVFLPLEERTAMANRVGADLFISIHANASPNALVRGVETYYLNFSRSDRAAAVAARENGTSLKQVGELELILFDLMANAKINESSRLAKEIHSAMVRRLSANFDGIRDHGVRQGPFYVLVGANMPSVLVEAGYISNAQEELLLTQPQFHERTAKAIVEGVRNFIQPPKGVAQR